MEIRSVTLFCDPAFDEKRAAAFFEAAQSAFHVPVQTCRVALPPFPDWWNEEPPVAEEAARIAGRWRDAGAGYVSLGPVQLHHEARWLQALPELLAVEEMVFASAEVADVAGRIDAGRCRGVARVIQQAATILDKGFGNLFFTALANCPPGSPFFPVAYHDGEGPAFALALEAADLAQRAFDGADSLDEARAALVQAIEQEGEALAAAASPLAEAHDLTFRGIDFSLAPFPAEGRSLAGAMETLGPAGTGAPGSIFAAAFVTEALDRARFPRCGFSGLMLPVLEDAVLARRAAEGGLSLNDLLAFSAVCGTGLDTIPLPGDVDEAILAGILLDVAALATRLDKPLTARLMPLPGLGAGDPVHFDFPYFADSRVMSPGGGGVRSLLAQDGALALRAINHD